MFLYILVDPRGAAEVSINGLNQLIHLAIDETAGAVINRNTQALVRCSKKFVKFSNQILQEAKMYESAFNVQANTDVRVRSLGKT